MGFAVMTERTLEIRARYDEYERRAYGREWSTEELTLGLVGDIGDLAKLIQAFEGVRTIDGEVSTQLGHELADILWSVITIAARCNVDLAASFAATMNDIEAGLAERLRAP